MTLPRIADSVDVYLCLGLHLVSVEGSHDFCNDLRHTEDNHIVAGRPLDFHRLRQGDSHTHMSSFAGGIAEQNDGSLLP